MHPYAYDEGVKEFAVYNVMRLLLLITWVCVVIGVWVLFAGALNRTEVLFGLIIAFVGSGISSWYLLARQREALAMRLGEGASRASQKYQEARKAPDEA